MKATLLAQAMCRPFLFLFILFSTFVIQDAVGQSDTHPIYGFGQPPPTSILVYIGSGSLIPNSTSKDQAYLTNSLGVNAGVNIPLLKKKTFSLGINAGGEYAFSNKDPFKTLPSPFHVVGETSSIVSSSGKSKQNSFNVGAGPQANFYLGKHIIVSPIFLVGYMSLTQNAFSATQTTVMDGNPYNYTLLSQTQTKTNGLALIPKLRLQYFLNRRIGFWAEANYTMGPTIKNTVSTFIPEGNPDNNGQYEFDQLQNGTIRTSTLPPGETKFKSFGVHIGVVFSILDVPHPEDDPLKKSKKPVVRDSVKPGIRDQPHGDDDGSLGIKSKTIPITCDIGTAKNDCKSGGGLCNCILGIATPSKQNDSVPVNKNAGDRPIVVLGQPPPNQRSMKVNIIGKDMYVHFVDDLPGDASVFVFDAPTALDASIAKELGYKSITIKPGSYKVRKEGKGKIVKIKVKTEGGKDRSAIQSASE